MISTTRILEHPRSSSLSRGFHLISKPRNLKHTTVLIYLRFADFRTHGCYKGFTSCQNQRSYGVSLDLKAKEAKTTRCSNLSTVHGFENTRVFHLVSNPQNLAQPCVLIYVESIHGFYNKPALLFYLGVIHLIKKTRNLKHPVVLIF